jgi:general secretion pathway protein C
MLARWWTLGVWAAAAAGAVFWGLRVFVTPTPLPPNTRTAAATAVVRGDLTKLFGVDAPPPPVDVAPEPAPDARFHLLGVVSPRPRGAASEGLALIAVDGKPARPFRVGMVVDGPTVLKSVNARGAMLGPRDGDAVVALSLAPPVPAATGALPVAAPAFPPAPPPLPAPLPAPVPPMPVPPISGPPAGAGPRPAITVPAPTNSTATPGARRQPQVYDPVRPLQPNDPEKISDYDHGGTQTR